MKSIQELQLSPADVEVLTPKVIAAAIEEVRRERETFAQFFKPDDDLVRMGGDRKIYPKAQAGITVQTGMAPGEAINPSNITYEGVTIVVQKHGVGVAFYGEALRQVAKNEIQRQITEAGRAYGDAMDILALEAMFPTMEFVAESAGTVTAAGTLVIGVKSAPQTASQLRINESGTSVVFTGAGTLVAWYIPSDRGAVLTSLANGSLSVLDIRRARVAMGAKYFTPDVILIHPDRLTDILYDPAVKFLESAAYAGQPLLTGELGKLWGMSVVVSNRVPRYGAILVSKNEVGYRLIRKRLELNEDRITGMNRDMIYFWGFAEEMPGVVNEASVGAVALKGTFSPIEVNLPR